MCTRIKVLAGPSLNEPLTISVLWNSFLFIPFPENSETHFCTSTTEESNGFLNLCSSCQVTTQLSNNFFPSVLNEIICNPQMNNTCINYRGVSECTFFFLNLESDLISFQFIEYFNNLLTLRYFCLERVFFSHLSILYILFSFVYNVCLSFDGKQDKEQTEF